MMKAFAARLRRIADRLDPPAPAWQFTTDTSGTATGTWATVGYRNYIIGG